MPATSRPSRSWNPCCIMRRMAALRSPWYSRSSVISSKSASASRSNPTCVPSQREYLKREVIDRSTACAVRRAAAERVLVEALGEMQALEHELDARRARGGRLARAERGEQRLQTVDVVGQLLVLGRGNVFARVHDRAAFERRHDRAEHLRLHSRPEHVEDRALHDAVEHLRVATVVEHLDLDL